MTTLQAGTGIYAIECLRTRRAYVGATKDGFEGRWYVHHLSLVAGKHHSRYLQRDWNAVGPGWFQFIVLEDVALGMAFAPREQAWMDTLRTWGFQLYNVHPAREGRLSILTLDAARVSSGVTITSRLPGVLTIGEVSIRLGVSPVTINRWIREEELPAYKRGRSWVIRHQDFEQCHVRRDEMIHREEVARLLGRDDTHE